MEAKPIKSKSKSGSFLRIICIILLLGLLALSYIALFMRKKASEQVRNLLVCSDNCKRISHALVLYYKDNEEKFPDKIIQLYPKYLKEIPECPCAKYDTYSESYQVSEKNDNFTIYCRGSFHLNAGNTGNPPNYPMLSPSKGLLIKPDR